MRAHRFTCPVGSFAIVLLAFATATQAARAGILEDFLRHQNAIAVSRPMAMPGVVRLSNDSQPEVEGQSRANARPGPLPATLEASPLSSFESGIAGLRLGTSVATAGDVNGDGFSDAVALGVRNNGPTSLYLFFGGPTGLTLAPGFPFTNLPAYASMVSGAGDLDGNGLADVVVGFPTATSGSFRIYYSRKGTLDTGNPFVVSGPNLDGFGEVVGPAGDINGDQVDDLIVGSPHSDNAPFYCEIGASGRVDVYFGAAVTGITTTNVWTVPGCLAVDANSWFGAAVATAGDVNGDGFDDIVIGAPYARRISSLPSAGRVFVVHGSASGLPMDPLHPTYGTVAGADVIESFQDGSGFGSTAITAGDVNGDGFAEIAIGSPYEDWDATAADVGFVRVFAGSSTGVQTGAPIWTAAGGPSNGLFGQRLAPAGDVNGDGLGDLLVGRRGVLSLAASAPGGLTFFPPSVNASVLELSFGTAGDVNGDGLSDVVVGDPGVSNPELSEGRVLVLAGRGEGPSLEPDWTFASGLSGPGLGQSVAAAGDVNGDGFDDVLTGAPQLPNIAVPGEFNNGGVFLNYGGLNGLTAGLSDWSYVGLPNDRVGTAVAAAGDVNGDGYGDIIVGAPQSGQGRGKVLLWLGRSGGLLPGSAPDQELIGPSNCRLYGSALSSGDFNGDGFADIAVGAPAEDYSQLPGSAFAYLGGPGGLDPTPVFENAGFRSGDRYGAALVAGADLNGDGFSDLAIGSPGLDLPPNDYNTGMLVAYRGAPGANPLSEGFSIIFGYDEEELGSVMSDAGDVNGDGRGDFIVGIPAFGMAMVLTVGPSDYLMSLRYWTDPAAGFGSSVSSAGDVDGDGLSDVLVGSPYEDVGGSREAGGARVFLGPLSSGAPVLKWVAGGLFDGQHFGESVALAGDVNADGWADLLVGSPDYTGPINLQGRSDLYFGAAGIAQTRIAVASRSSGTVIQPHGLADAASFKLAGITGSAAGRTRVRLQWQADLPVAFPSASHSGIQGSFLQTTPPGPLGSIAVYSQTVGGLATGAPYSWRARSLSRSLYFPTSRWLAPTRNGPREYDLRTPGSWVAVEPAPPVATPLQLGAPWPSPTRAASRISFDLPASARVSLEVLDLQGRTVRSLLDGEYAAGPYQAEWDGTDAARRPVASGVYFYRLRVGDSTRSRRVVLLH